MHVYNKECACNYVAMYIHSLVRQPKLQIAPIPTVVYSGQTATFFCFATGYNVNYQWTIGSGSFPSKVTGVNNNMLVIPDVKRSDDNTYTCVASNDGGSVQSNATQLTVIGMHVICSYMHSSASALNYHYSNPMQVYHL